MNNRKFYTCCFTGHRPHKLPWGYIEHGIRFLLLKIKLTKLIKKAVKQGYIYFISGMALGSDMLFAEIVLKLKKKHPNIKLECALPCSNQTEKWLEYNIKRYNKILSKADKITQVSTAKFSIGCMTKRNNYMIDKSSLLIAVYNGLPGGTRQTIEKAKNKNLQIKIIKP